LFGHPKSVKKQIIKILRAQVKHTADAPENLPDPSSHAKELAECGGAFYVSDGVSWVKNAVGEQ